nr:hypothetical protein GCM10020092_093820 [Actinoplanes digitatis]
MPEADLAPRVPGESPPVPGQLPPVSGESLEEADEELLPRRVRQASLAPQLRGPVAERVTARHLPLTGAGPQPDERATARHLRGPSRGGRPEHREEPGEKPTRHQSLTKRGRWGARALSEAATVTFPAVQSPVVAGIPAGDDSAPEENHENHENRPEKDA